VSAVCLEAIRCALTRLAIARRSSVCARALCVSVLININICSETGVAVNNNHESDSPLKPEIHQLATRESNSAGMQTRMNNSLNDKNTDPPFWPEGRPFVHELFEEISDRRQGNIERRAKSSGNINDRDRSRSELANLRSPNLLPVPHPISFLFG